ncbi:hypothetical protein F5884DRAFT_818826 [Xylogone sp. PMI_703]|nr:hypothetical protein F5884DRAFT_818826 [Xylogone sp. PMI_703]
MGVVGKSGLECLGVRPGAEGQRIAQRAAAGPVHKSVNLDFDARVPIPFSLFPSSYRSDAGVQTTTTTTKTRIEGEILATAPERLGREDQYSSYTASLPPRQEQQFKQEEVFITREEDRHHRPSRREEIRVREEFRPDTRTNTTHIEVDIPRHRRRNSDSEIDITERQLRSRFQPNYREQPRVTQAIEYTPATPRFQPNFREDIRVSNSTVDVPPSRFEQPSYRQESRVAETTVDPPRFLPLVKREKIQVTEETVEPPRIKESKKMGYYDDEGHHHGFRNSLARAADRLIHPTHREEIDININNTSSGPSGSVVSSGSSSNGSPYPPNTVTIPCHHIRIGDLLILQGRPCQVIRITTSAATGQHRYLGVDLFTKQLHEESSFVEHPSPSVVVQTMLGPVFKQYRVLDMHDGTIVAMTETGDVKQAVGVLDQSNLWERLSEAFHSGRGSLRALVITDHGRELVVDMKVIHGSRL